MWKYFAKPHGKCVIDGIGGNIKILVREQMRSQSQHVVIQSIKYFVDLAFQLASKTRVIYVPSYGIFETIESASPWNKDKAIVGILKCVPCVT